MSRGMTFELARLIYIERLMSSFAFFIFVSVNGLWHQLGPWLYRMCTHALYKTLNCGGVVKGHSQIAPVCLYFQCNVTDMNISSRTCTAHPTATPAEVKQVIVDEATDGKMDASGLNGTPNKLVYSLVK